MDWSNLLSGMAQGNQPGGFGQNPGWGAGGGMGANGGLMNWLQQLMQQMRQGMPQAQQNGANSMGSGAAPQMPMMPGATGTMVNPGGVGSGIGFGKPAGGSPMPPSPMGPNPSWGRPMTTPMGSGFNFLKSFGQNG